MNKIILSFVCVFCVSGFSDILLLESLVKGNHLDFMSDECWEGYLLGGIRELERSAPVKTAFAFGNAYVYGVDDSETLKELQEHHRGQFNRWLCQQEFVQKKDVGVKGIKKLPEKYSAYVEPAIQNVLSDRSFIETAKAYNILESKPLESFGFGFFQKDPPPSLEKELLEKVADKGKRKFGELKDKQLSKEGRLKLVKKAKKKAKIYINKKTMSSEEA